LSKESAIIFDDGSIESKVLQYELKTSYDITTVQVEKYEDLPKWLDEAIKKTEGLFKGIIKIILHFPFEDYVQKDIRDQMMALERKHPNIRIIPWYEQAPRDGIKNRAANYGIVAEPIKLDKPLREFRITDTGEIEIDKVEPPKSPTLTSRDIDPDDEMKANVSNIASDIITNVESEGFTLHKDEPKKKGKKKKWNI